MSSILPENEYKYKNLLKEEYIFKNTFYFYCDNLQEGMHILFWLEKYNTEMKLIKRGYDGIAKYISIYDIDGEKFSIVILSYYHNGELPREVRQIIYKIDKPDVVIFSVKEDKIICGIENTETAFVGNATWQRHGRIMNFLENDFPFIFFAYYTKKDVSRNAVRKPSPLFVLSFFALSIENSTPAIVSLYEHDDINQNMINKDGTRPKDTRLESFQYILSLMRFGRNSETTIEKLTACFNNMKDYYNFNKGIVKEKEIPCATLNKIRNEKFSDLVVEKIKDKDKDYPLFVKEDCSENYLFDWKPVSSKEYVVNNKKVGINEYLKNQLDDLNFYELSPKCPAGITFDTEKLVKILTNKKNNGDYFWEDSLDLNIPTIIILLKLTKKGVISLPDPYNGRIPAFYEMYKQSFGKINCIMYLMDHSSKNEYNPELAKNMKIYKTINDYATIFIDRDLNIIDKNCDKVVRDSRNKYKIETTEDNVTCFFETVLKQENIEPSFINPPCGSWSDFKLLPTNRYMYLQRDNDRPDIAYYYIDENGNGKYYFGESKSDWSNFKDEQKFNFEIDRINRLLQTAKKELDLKMEFKTFIIFKGYMDQAEYILNKVRNNNWKKVDYVVVIEENNEGNYNIEMKIIEV